MSGLWVREIRLYFEFLYWNFIVRGGPIIYVGKVIGCFHAFS